jgi:hypothetical protein
MILYKSKSTSTNLSYHKHFYTNGVSVNNLNDFRNIVADQYHTTIKFNNGEREKGNFIKADCLMLDVDEGMTIVDFEILFADYKYYYATSRHHQKEKVNKTTVKPACDRFHVFFPLEEEILDSKVYEESILKLIQKYRFFDDNCKDAGRFLTPSGKDVIVKEHLEGKYINALLDTLTITTKTFTIIQPLDDLRNMPDVMDQLYEKKSRGYFADYNEWLKLGTVLKANNYTAQDWAKLSDDPNDVNCYKYWDGLNPDRLPEGYINHFLGRTDKSFKKEFDEIHELKIGEPYVWTSDDKDKMLEYFDSRFYRNTIGGKSCVIIRDEKNSLSGTPLKLVEWRKSVSQKQVYDNDKKKMMPASSYWENQTYEQYFGEVFDPSTNERIVNEKVNLWEGLALNPVKGNCDVLINFIRNNIGSGNETYYDWLVGYMSHIVREPKNKETHIVALIGEPGCGKSSFIKILERIFGNYSLVVDDAERVLGRFNGALKNKIIINLDEATFRGDKKTSNKIKNMVTSNTLNIENKGFEIQQFPNYIRLWITSNDENSCFIEDKDRRYFVLKVINRSSEHEWIKIHEAIESDVTMSAFLEYLISYESATYKSYSLPPLTELKLESQIDNLNSIAQFVISYIENGDDMLKVKDYRSFDGRISKYELYQRYKDQLQGFKENQIKFSRTFREYTGWTTVKSNGSEYWEIGTQEQTKSALESKLKITL